MKTRFVFATLAIVISSSVFAQEAVNYNETVALVKERATPLSGSPVPKELIYVVSPRTAAETVFEKGVGQTRNVPLTYIFAHGPAFRLQQVLVSLQLSNATNLIARIYRPGQSQTPVAEISGLDINQSQFPIKAGDLIVITEEKKK